MGGGHEKSRFEMTLSPTDIEEVLQKVRIEAEKERNLDQELDAIPETAYQDVDRFLKTTINKLVPLPEIMPLDNGEICLEWREGQKIFTLSFGGDGNIVFAGVFGEENHARGNTNLLNTPPYRHYWYDYKPLSLL